VRISEPLAKLLLVNVAVPVESTSAEFSEVPLPHVLCSSGAADAPRPARAAPLGRVRAAAIRTASLLPPRQNVTLPNGEPVGTGAIVAVNVTACPAFVGFGETVRVVIVAMALLITSLMLFEIEAAEPAFPE
jgi:hypothetical protein